MDGIGKDRIRAHETDLRRYAEELLKPINSLRFIGHAPEKGAIISFAMEGAHAHDVATILDRSGIAVRAGTHCAEPLLARFGLTSTCRASFGLYNTRAEVEALAEGLQKAERFFR
jgi:cysteine desulfurase/selenocysteine lyase